MCVITILHCTPCEFRQDMPEEGLIITKDWHNQLLVNLDFDTIPFKRCVNAINHALNNGRSDTMYHRCRNVETKHMAATEGVCYRCSTRRKIQNLTAMRQLYEEQSVTWRNEEQRDTEAVNDMRRSIKESSQKSFTTGSKRVSCATSGFLTTRLASVTRMMENWEYCLERQIQQKGLVKTKETERRAGLAENGDKKEKRKQARLASLQQRLAHVNRLRDSSIKEDDVEQGSSSRCGQSALESASEPSSMQDTPASPKKPSPAMTAVVSSDLRSSNTFVERFHTMGLASTIKIHLSSEESSVGAAMHPVAGYASVRGFSTLRAEAPEFASLQGFPRSLRARSLRAEAPEFKPLRQAPPTEPRMMRAPIAPRAMRQGSLRQASSKPRQKYSTIRGYPTLRGWRE